MSVGHTGSEATNNEEHRSINGINAKAVVPYELTTSASILPSPIPLIDAPYDYIGWTNPDTNGNYQTLTFRNGGAAGAVVRTLNLTYDASNNLTSLGRV